MAAIHHKKSVEFLAEEPQHERSTTALEDRPLDRSRRAEDKRAKEAQRDEAAALKRKLRNRDKAIDELKREIEEL